MSLNMNDINYDDFKNICRMCMLNCDVKFYQDFIVSNIYHKLTDLHFVTNDDLPKQICRKCFEKIIDIHEFALHCKRTHSALMECLNKKQNVAQNKSIKKRYKLRIILDKNVEHTTEIVENDYLNSTVNQKEIKPETNVKLNDDTIQETCEIKEEIIENTDLQETSYNIEEEISIEKYNIEFIKDEHLIVEISEINNDQSINCLEDPLLISNTKNLDEDTILSNCSKTSNIYSSETNKNEVKKYKCDQCSKTFNYLNNGRYHKHQHDGERPYRCNRCSKSLNQSENLTEHMRSENSERSLKCDICSKTFKYPSHLKTPMLSHSSERPYKCEQCARSFICLGHLKTHILTHSSERPFKCKQCTNSYVKLSHFNAHMRTYTGERPYKCKQRLKAFVQCGTLTKHLRTHTGGRPFKCEQCSKTFTRSDYLKTHMHVHTGEHPYKCDQCSKSFARSDVLKKHLRTHTRERPNKRAKSFNQSSRTQ